MEQKALLAAFGQGYEDLIAVLNTLPQEAFAYKPSADAWSVHEIVVHLADSEAIGFARFRWAVAQPGITITAYDQDLWADRTFYSDQDLQLSLSLIQHVRQSTYEWLCALPETAWEGWIQHPERGVESLERILEINTDHITLHVRQIQENYARWQAEQRKIS